MTLGWIDKESDVKAIRNGWDPFSGESQEKYLAGPQAKYPEGTKQWEYTTLRLDPYLDANELAKFALKGWELVTVYTYGPMIFVSVFKRPLVQIEET